MSGFTIKAPRFRKVQGDASSLAALDDKEIVEAIVKVNESGYVPKGVTVRAHIHSRMLTGELPTEILDNLEHDPKVDAVSISRKLRIIE